MNKYSLKMNLTKNTKKIIEYLLKNIDKIGFNVNQLAKNIKISVGSSHKILKVLKKENMVQVIDLKSSIYYKLNLNNPDTIDICKLILRENKRKLSSITKTYVEEIEKFDADILILFGSILGKKEFNDVDVLFVTDKVKEVNKFCNKILKTKPVNPLIMPFKDFIKNRKTKVVIEIINKGVVLKGEEKYLDALNES